jgi:hypothetical protein
MLSSHHSGLQFVGFDPVFPALPDLFLVAEAIDITNTMAPPNVLGTEHTIALNAEGATLPVGIALCLSQQLLLRWLQ